MVNLWTKNLLEWAQIVSVYPRTTKITQDGILRGKVTIMLKLRKNTKNAFLPVLGLMSDSLTTISVESNLHQLSYWPKDQSCSISQKNMYWELTVLKFFCLIPWKVVEGSWVARMGHFDDYPGFQPMRSWANTYSQDCNQQFH